MVTSLNFDDENDIPEDIPNLEETIKTFVKSMGGTICNSTVRKRSPASNKPSCILVAPSHQRTIKYLTALAARVPCVHYNWILHMNKLVSTKKHPVPSSSLFSSLSSVPFLLRLLHLLPPLHLLHILCLPLLLHLLCFLLLLFVFFIFSSLAPYSFILGRLPPPQELFVNGGRFLT